MIVIAVKKSMNNIIKKQILIKDNLYFVYFKPNTDRIN